jgi:hypothetical protein
MYERTVPQLSVLTGLLGNLSIFWPKTEAMVQLANCPSSGNGGAVQPTLNDYDKTKNWKIP